MSSKTTTGTGKLFPACPGETHRGGWKPLPVHRRENSCGIWRMLLLAAALVLSVPAVQARHTDEDPVERDIRLAEGVLSELLSETIPVRSRMMSVSGRYIPGYGVHFTVEMRRAWTGSGRRRGGDDRRAETEEQEAYEDGRKETVEKITEFFTRYAHLIRNLEESEEVRVTVRSNPPHFLLRSGEGPDLVMRLRAGRSGSLPLVSMGVTAGDLNLFRRESVSEEELIRRIRRDDFDRERDETDLRVFASVLETALELVESEHLSLRGRPQFEYIPGMGAHYRMRISTGGRLTAADLQIGQILPEEFGRRLGEELQEQAGRMRFPDSVAFNIPEEEFERIMEQIRRAGEEAARARRHVAAAADSLRARGFHFGRPAASPEELREEIDAFRRQIDEIVVRYGSTLVSLADDEWLLFTIEWGLRHEELPERTELGIRKRDLLDGGAPQEMTARSD